MFRNSIADNSMRDFWPGHYLEVQIYHILIVDKVGKRAANRNEYLKPVTKQGGEISFQSVFLS